MLLAVFPTTRALHSSYNVLFAGLASRSDMFRLRPS